MDSRRIPFITTNYFESSESDNDVEPTTRSLFGGRQQRGLKKAPASMTAAAATGPASSSAGAVSFNLVD